MNFNTFRPKVNGCKNPEPLLEEMIVMYYMDVFSREESEKIAKEYMAKLKAELEPAQSLMPRHRKALAWAFNHKHGLVWQEDMKPMGHLQEAMDILGVKIERRFEK
jgi:hypothetical protein